MGNPISLRGLDPELWKKFRAECIMEEITYGAKLNALIKAYLAEKKAKGKENG